jgi:hypothetical protein
MSKKFVVFYRMPVEVVAEWRKNTPPEEMEAQDKKLGAEMTAWTEKNKTALIDRGLPLGKNKRMTAAGTEDVANDLNYYCVVEAESVDEVVEMFKDNPHLKIPSAFLDILEVPHMGL